MKIRFENVSFVYPAGVQALAQINLEFPAGAAVAILGENGAGKTTLARHMNGLLKPTAGTVLIGGWDSRVHTVAQLAHRVAYAFQNPADQLFERTVFREVAFGPQNLGLAESAVQERVSRALEGFGILELADRHPYDLHPAQRKLVALASVVAMETPVIVLDEPTTGLDDRETGRVGQVLEHLRSAGRTLIAISHDVDFCAEHFDRTVVMAGGQILSDGPAHTVLGQMEVLRRAGVEAPELVRLARALDLPGTPRTVEEFDRILAAARPENS